MSRRGFLRCVQRILSSLAVFAVSAGICAALFVCVNASEAVYGMKALLLSGFTDGDSVQKTLLYWPLLILTGLSVGMSWKAGILQVGAQGQFVIGLLLALTGAVLLAPWWVCLAMAALGGALWSMLAFLLKNRSRVNVILSAVMLNFIALYLAQWLWEDQLSGLVENASPAFAFIPAIQAANGFSVSFGLLLALVLCVALWVVMRFTVIGFEMKAAGSGLEAAERAGMPVRRNRLAAVVLSGAFSGLAGGICLLSGMMDSSLSVISFQTGYIGIAVAALCFGHPLGTVFTALAASGICAGSEALPSVFPREVGLILLGLMLLGSAALRWKKREYKS